MKESLPKSSSIRSLLTLSIVLVFALSILLPPGTCFEPEITEYVIPHVSDPIRLAIDTRGVLWFTEYFEDTICSFSPESGEFVQYPLPDGCSGPGAITVDPQGRVWYTACFSGHVVMFDPKKNKATVYQTSTFATGIAYSPRTGVWYADAATGVLGNIDPKTGVVTEHPVPDSLGLWEVEVDLKGWPWFTDPFTDRIGVFNPSTKEFTLYDMPTGSYPQDLVIDSKGMVWITEYLGNNLAMLDPRTGQITEYLVPTPECGPCLITLDNKGNVWFTEDGRFDFGYTKAWKVTMFDTTTKTFQEYVTPTPESGPISVVFDPRGNIWFNEWMGCKIGRITLHP